MFSRNIKYKKITQEHGLSAHQSHCCVFDHTCSLDFEQKQFFSWFKVYRHDKCTLIDLNHTWMLKFKTIIRHRNGKWHVVPSCILTGLVGLLGNGGGTEEMLSSLFVWLASSCFIFPWLTFAYLRVVSEKRHFGINHFTNMSNSILAAIRC